jgi:hypothetical protein
MILRKPYAFFIKNFRLMHVIITILIGYLAFKTYPLLEFLDGYLSNQVYYIGKVWTTTYFNNYMFVFPILVIAISIMIMSVLIRKKKPSRFYLINIFVMVFTMIYYTSLYNSMVTIETQIINVQIMRAYKDIAVFLLGFQFIAILITFARASGFDVKKFDFGKDLKELNLQESDREEVEVQINVDTDKVKRKRNHILRYAKYYYLENKEIYNGVFITLGVILVSWLLMDHYIFNRTYLYDNYFSASSFTMRIKNSYLITEDNYGNKITPDGKSLIVINMQVKDRINNTTAKLPTYRMAILLNGIHYYPVTTYRDRISDLGITYENQDITNTYNYYLLTYEVPTKYLGKSMEFNYVLGYNFGKTIEPNIIHVNLGYTSIDGTAKKLDYTVGDLASLKDSVASDINIIINSAEMNTTFENDYNSCYNKVCLLSKEYVRANLNTNYDKALLKLNINYGTNEEMDNLKKFSELIKYYGKIEYQKDNTLYTDTNLVMITPKYNVTDNTYYIEIKKDVMEADSVFLVLDVRNYEYRFKIK